MEKRGQVTLFIIVGIVFVVGIVALVIFMWNVDVDSPVDLGPRAFVGKCVRDAIEESVVKVLVGGGEIVPSQSIMYMGHEWNYLCYQADNGLRCYNLHPMLEMKIESEIRQDTMDDVQDCFNVIAVDFENSGYDVSGGATNYSIDLLPGKIDINLEKDIEIVKDGVAQNFADFDTSVLSSTYNLIQIAREVVNSEFQYCNFEYNNYMLLYPKYDIRRIDYFGSKIYRLIDRASGDEFKFATRSCAMEKFPLVGGAK